MKSELLKQIDGYPEYWVSSIGNVYSTKRGVMKKLKPLKHTNGYLQVSLWKNGNEKHFKIHRLVAQAFILNPDNLPQVNHINEDKTDNRVSNLEWCTCVYNQNYGTRTERSAKAKINGKKSKPVLQFSLNGTLVREWPSVMEVERETGWSNSNISECCNGRRKTAYGYRWSYYI